mmetsp:Transcript_1434/g.2347  ORF Transcript_1434/g.2347 Transcript_1434/m.2347 type:complete len:101 (-) Transcript_1434:607-909(-)
MCTYRSNFLKKFDLLGAPVGVAFNGDYSHSTRAGGFASCFALILIAVSLFIGILQYFEGSYETEFNREHDKVGNHRETWSMSTNLTTVAGGLSVSQGDTY